MRWPWPFRRRALKALPAAAPEPPTPSWTPEALTAARAALGQIGLAGMLPAAASTADTSVAKAAGYGAGGFTPSAQSTPPTQPAGADGVQIVGGFVVSNERDPRLTGTRKWITFDNQVANVAVIGAAVNVWTKLGGSAKWTTEPNAAGGPGAELGAEIVQEGLLEAQLSTPWNQVVRRQLMKAFRGFALHECVVRRRRDDVIVVGDLLDRPQWTVWRWNRPDERGPWIGVEQQTQLTMGGAAPYIPRERLFYSVENTLTSSPEGFGFLRQVAEATRVLELYNQWEGIGFQTDLRGVPLARAPLSALKEQAKAAGARSDAEINAYIQGQTRFLASFLAGHDKTSEQGVMLDSAVYTDLGPTRSPSATYKWAFDLIRGSTSGMPEIGAAISRLIRDIARVMCAEWLLLGGEDSGGAYSMHEDKTAMFGLIVNSALSDIAADAQRDIAQRLIALNGLDPETCTPRLVPEPVATGAVKDACASLAALAMANLQPGDPAIDILRSRLDLPPAPVMDAYDLALGSGAAGGGPPAPDGSEQATPGTDGEPVDAAADAEAVKRWLAEPDVDSGWLEYDIQKDYVEEQHPRGEHGMWSSGGAGGGSAAHGGGYSAWTHSFDSREHDKQINTHRAAEEKHRAAGAKIKDQIAGLKDRARDGTPKQQASLKVRADKLKEQYETHRTAAATARDARRGVQQNLERARGEHTAGRLAAAGARREYDSARGEHEHAGGMAIGHSRIGGESEHEPAGGSTAVPHYAETPEHHFGIGTGTAIRGEPEHEHVPQGTTELHRHGDEARRPESERVSTVQAKPRTTEEWRQHDRARHAARQEHERRSRERFEANRPKGDTVAPAAHEPLPEARARGGGLLSRLRGLFGRKKASAVDLPLTSEDEELLREFERWLESRGEEPPAP